MKVKSTKRSLLVSGLLLLLCVSMLVGSTFAWFTDSVTSKNNIIKSGNLDVQLFYAATEADVEADNWTEVTSSTDIFGYNLWEPGYVKTAFFKVVNAGSLALKYSLSADVYAETAGVNKAGESFLLSDSIKTSVVDLGATREEILAMPGENLKQSITISENAQELYPAGEADGLTKLNEKVFGFAIWMPTTVGNEANHNGTDVPSIDFGINLLATQQTYEFDSFGSDYDTGAQYPVAAFGSAAVDANASSYEIDLVKADGGKVGSVTIPAEAVADEAATLSVTVIETQQDPTVDVGSDQDARTFDITINGLKEGNTEEVMVQLNMGTGLTGVEVYQNNVKVDNAVYNANTGHIIFKTTSFSPYTVVYDAEPVEEELDETLPRASVVDADQFEETALEWGSYGAFSPSNPDQQLESAYIFSDANGIDWVKNSAYKNWECDYYVMMDCDVEAGAVFLGGNYGDWGWIGFENPEFVAANTEVPLLGSVVQNAWTYESVIGFVETFTCGVSHLDESLNGATFTVILRLTNPADEADIINVATVEYTFDNTPA